jgi:hypothetical protein
MMLTILGIITAVLMIVLLAIAITTALGLLNWITRPMHI